MALKEKQVYQVEITENDNVQVRTKTIIYRDGVPISNALHRHVITPGEDATGEVGKARRMVAAAHVPTVVTLHNAREVVSGSGFDGRSQADQAQLRNELRQAEIDHDAFLDAE